MTDEPRTFFVGRHLLDVQVVGLHDDHVGKVDDVELELRDGELPVVTAILSGQIAYGGRFHGWFGRVVTGMAQRMRLGDDLSPRRFDASLIRSIGAAVVLNVPATELSPPELEQWLADHVIGRIPGGG